MKYSFMFGKRNSVSAASGDDEAGPQSPTSPTGRGPRGTVTSTGQLSAVESVDVAAGFVCSERFANRFWTDDERCISVLMHKLKSAKQTCSDMLSMVGMRAAMEEELGKKLGKLARAGLGSEEVGGTKDALRTMRAELDANARAHTELAKQLRAEIERPLAAFIADQRLKRRAQTMIIQKTEGDRNALRSQVRKLLDKRRVDTKRVGDLKLQINGLQNNVDPKAQAKAERAEAQKKANEAEYVDVRARLKDADRQWFNVWRSACDVFQVLEEERIEYLKTALWTYTNLVSSCCVADDESMERIRQDLEKISVADDISAFIQAFGTGAPDPVLARAAGVDADAESQAEPQAKPARFRDESSDAEDAPPPPPQQQQQRRVQARPSGPSAVPAPAQHHMPPASSANNTVNSRSTGCGTTRSGSVLGQQQQQQQPPRPQTQESMRHMQRPASMHGMGPGVAIPGHPQQQQHYPQQHQQQPPVISGSPSWSGRPGSSMQGPASFDGTYRRASNNDMYAMANGHPQPQPQPQPQYVQRTNSQAGMYAPDPRAPSSMGGYRTSATASPMLVPAQQQQQPVQGHMGDMGGGYVVQGVAHMGSPLLRTGTYNGPAHTGNFGTLTGTAHMQQPFAGGGSSPHHPQQQQPQPQQHGGSAPSSPYIQAMGAARPGSAAGMHQRSPSAMQGHPMAAGRPVSAMQGGGPGPYAVPPAAAPPGYRAATPVQQQQQQHSPQYITRPPTQMAAAPSPRMHARAPSQMGAYGHPPMPQQQQQQQQIPPRSVSRVEPPGRSVTESGKEILFYVKVLYDYDADNDKELSIREGDVISVLAVSADGWWEGEMTDRRTGRPLHGTFPSNFTDPIANLIS